jgi:hypothetical protein
MIVCLDTFDFIKLFVIKLVNFDLNLINFYFDVIFQDCLNEMSAVLHPNHALMMTAKRFLLQCLSQLPAERVKINQSYWMTTKNI